MSTTLEHIRATFKVMGFSVPILVCMFRAFCDFYFEVWGKQSSVLDLEVLAPRMDRVRTFWDFRGRWVGIFLLDHWFAIPSGYFQSPAAESVLGKVLA